MIYAPRYIFNSDSIKNICSCDGSKKYRVLFSHSNSIEYLINNKIIFISSEVTGACSKCGRVYRFKIIFNPSLNTVSDIELLEEVKEDIRSIKNSMYKRYKSFEDTLCFKSDYHLVKVISEKYDNYKKFTEYMYIEK